LLSASPMDDGYMMHIRYPSNGRVKALSEACLDRPYECPSPVDQQQLDDLHITVYDAEKD